MLALALLTLWAWALASPAGASPDDDFHMASIWCAAGDRPGLCESVNDPDFREVARDLVEDSTCFAFDPTQSAACQGADFGSHPTDTVVTSRGNFDGLYPPLFYLAMSTFASSDIDASIITMRFINSVFEVAVFGSVIALLPTTRRHLVIVPALAGTVPMGLFLFGSVNPSSWAILSAATFWVALLAYFETTGWRRIALAGAALITLVIGGGARADSAAYSGLAIVVVLILRFSNTRDFYLRAIAPAALFVLALILYRWGSQTNAATAGLGDYSDGTVDRVALALANFMNTPELWIGALGRDSLGWLDTGMPGAVWVAVSACYLGLFFWSLRQGSFRKFLALSILIGALWILPTVLLTQSGATVGIVVQSRYLIPLMLILLGVALERPNSSPRSFHLAPMQMVLIIGGLASANLLALHTNIRRYVSGNGDGGFNLDADQEWWWTSAPSPMTIWIVGSISFAALLLLTFLPYWTRAADEALLRGTPGGVTSHEHNAETQTRSPLDRSHSLRRRPLRS